ncbi:choice-of-anchor L domain-containing protein [Flavobacterium sp. IMCC34518]|uniref:T9SS type B sorting domain-containing protein n=1 Tax=Flavobacterium sp. IMCC34518 TaxID=3003623 RepID=UPI0022ABF6D3|nr:choice-of-anchor L domain-containing protein [Flavobacterium sp. IMCC34518]
MNAQVITVDDTRSAQDLVENVLVKSSCANVTNTNATGDNFTIGQKSYGYFNANSSNFPFAEGILLTTSSSKKAIGPYSSNLGGGDQNWKGDPDLNQTLGITSINATVLEFDFISLTNFISFNYIFASNEYQLYFPCEFSDGFAFLIKEANTTDNYKNIAILPGTSTPVSSKNIHPIINSYIDNQNITHPGCNAINESFFNGYNNASSPINYSGQTIQLNAQADVVIGKTYHVKLVIADAGPVFYDSAVFLEKGSFSAKLNLGPDRTSTTNNPICFGETYTIDTKLPTNYKYEWYKDGSTTAITGETNPTLNITNSGTYKVKVILAPSTCIAEDEIKIEYAPQIVLKDATLFQCDDNTDGFSVYDLTIMDGIIKNNDPKIVKFAYFKTLSDAQNETNPITNPTNYNNSIPNETLYARATNAFGCASYAKLDLKIANNIIAAQSPIESCDTDANQDGITQFDLNSQVTPQVISGLPNGLTVEYYLNQTDAIAQKNKLSNSFTNTIPNQQIIYARIVNGPDCFKIIPETLIINTFDAPNFQDESVSLCDGANTDLIISSEFSGYLWSNGATTNKINIATSGEYSVTATNLKGCQKIKKFIVSSSGIGTITNVTVANFSGVNNSITISYTGNGNYELSLDGNLYQDNPFFVGISPGIYWATARDKNGCGISTPYKIYVLDYPRFFTPNNDGNNDTWKIKNLEILPKSSLSIFDRYGKILKQLNTSNSGWNGTYIGKELPSDDYWFVLTFEDGKTIKGHFSLIR